MPNKYIIQKCEQGFLLIADPDSVMPCLFYAYSTMKELQDALPAILEKPTTREAEKNDTIEKAVAILDEMMSKDLPSWELQRMAETAKAHLQEGGWRSHSWGSEQETKTTPVKCLLCDSEAVAIFHAPNGCTCAPNKIQPRCQQHVLRADDTGEELYLLEDFRIPQPPKEK